MIEKVFEIELRDEIRMLECTQLTAFLDYACSVSKRMRVTLRHFSHTLQCCRWRAQDMTGTQARYEQASIAGIGTLTPERCLITSNV